MPSERACLGSDYFGAGFVWNYVLLAAEDNLGLGVNREVGREGEVDKERGKGRRRRRKREENKGKEGEGKKRGEEGRAGVGRRRKRRI